MAVVDYLQSLLMSPIRLTGCCRSRKDTASAYERKLASSNYIRSIASALATPQGSGGMVWIERSSSYRTERF